MLKYYLVRRIGCRTQNHGHLPRRQRAQQSTRSTLSHYAGPAAAPPCTGLSRGFSSLREAVEAAPPPSEPGEKKLTQTTEALSKDKPLKVVSEQRFLVDAPQFSLPDVGIYSVHPPPGYADEHRILPHVLLSTRTCLRKD
jgi:hypothetical protein